MKILILSFFYYPDLSAGSFRASSLVSKLLEKNEDLEIELITTFPNRYNNFDPGKFEDNRNKNLKIHRVKIPSHKMGILDQSIGFLYFSFSVLKITFGKDYHLIFATSSKLMTASLGAFLSFTKKIPLYLDIRDLFSDTLKSVYSKSVFFLIFPLIKLLEKITFNRTNFINIVSEGFSDYVLSVNPEAKIRIYTNGVDDFFLNKSIATADKFFQKKPLIVYAGNIGEGQGLHKIIPEIASKLLNKASFKIIGNGGMKDSLQDALLQKKISNVELIDPIPRKDLINYYLEADILFLHLNDFEAFKKVLPSKIFEYAALGKPIIGGLAGYAATFLEDEVDGSEVFTPCDEDGFYNAYQKIILKNKFYNRENFVNKFSRNHIMDDMSKDIINIIKKGL